MTDELQVMDYDAAIAAPMTLCLGFFDSVHLGHQHLIAQARLLGHKYGCGTGVFTFSDNPFELLGKGTGQVLSFEERCYRLRGFGVDYVLSARFDKTFADLSPERFLETLFADKTVRAVIVGNDYTFGKNAAGGLELLGAFCAAHGTELRVCDLRMFRAEEKFSSRYVRNLVAEGRVEEICEHLGQPYIVMGTVERGRGEGRRMRYPTANIRFDSHKQPLKSGVYATEVILNGVRLRAITSVGTHPTFGDAAYNVETYIPYYNGDLYGKKIVVAFYRRLRDLCKFDNAETLAAQIGDDLQAIL